MTNYTTRQAKEAARKMRQERLITQSTAEGTAVVDHLHGGFRIAPPAAAPRKHWSEYSEAELDRLPAELEREIRREKEAADAVAPVAPIGVAPKKYTDAEMNKMGGDEYKRLVIDPDFKFKQQTVRAAAVPVRDPAEQVRDYRNFLQALAVAIGLDLATLDIMDERILRHPSFITRAQFDSLVPAERNFLMDAVNTRLGK